MLKTELSPYSTPVFLTHSSQCYKLSVTNPFYRSCICNLVVRIQCLTLGRSSHIPLSVIWGTEFLLYYSTTSVKKKKCIMCYKYVKFLIYYWHIHYKCCIYIYLHVLELWKTEWMIDVRLVITKLIKREI